MRENATEVGPDISEERTLGLHFRGYERGQSMDEELLELLANASEEEKEYLVELIRNEAVRIGLFPPQHEIEPG